MKQINLKTWNRKEHFEFFKNYNQPFFGVTAEVNITKAYKKSKDLGVSFFLYYLHKSLQAINELESFRYRIIEGGQVVVYDKIRAGTTINRPDGTFSFSYIPYHLEFNVFKLKAIGMKE